MPTISFPNGIVINYGIKREGKVSLRIYDIAGRCVKVVEDSRRQAGIYHTKWNGYDNNRRRVAAGIYFIRMETGSFHSTKKVLLVR
jgi:flagellar hook assembly protein FlgD